MVVSKFFSKTGVVLLYCLPAVMAGSVLGYSLYLRSVEVSKEIRQYIQKMDSDSQTLKTDLEKIPLKENQQFKALIALLEREKIMGTLSDYKNQAAIWLKFKKIWMFKSMIISFFTVLPYLLIGGCLSFGDKAVLGQRNGVRIAGGDFVMKFLVAFIIAYGWTYILHPNGRGAGLAEDFINSIDVISFNTLPIHVNANNSLAPVICGFLGWYIHLMGYFIQKCILGDVRSTRVYGLLFKKFLLVWGIALVVASLVQGAESKLIMFWIGLFPLSTPSLLKEFGVKTFQGDVALKDSLTHLPALSRWNVVRLEEEGIENVHALAACNPAAVKAAMFLAPSIVDLWIDAARLFSVLGSEKYARIKDFCLTATEFIRNSKNAEFIRTLKEKGQIENPDEIRRILQKSYCMAVDTGIESPAAS